MKEIALFLLILSLLTGFAGCADKRSAEPLSETRLLLDTYCTITVYGSKDLSLLSEAMKLCEDYEALFGISVQDSDVWRINHAGGKPVAAAPQTIEVIKAGLEFGSLSGGMFDITIGRLSTLWNFSGVPYIPTSAELEEAGMTVDHTRVNIDGDMVWLENPETWLDLGAIAKGYIADRLADFMKDRGVTGAVIDLGGDVAIVGEKPDSDVWRVGIRQPFGGMEDLIGIVETGEAAVVTSGVYERQFIQNGTLYHHIIDPYTGMPVISDIVGATVMAETAMSADVLSTIAVLAGSERAEALLCGSTGFIGALLILNNGDLVRFGDIVVHSAG